VTAVVEDHNGRPVVAAAEHARRYWDAVLPTLQMPKPSGISDAASMSWGRRRGTTSPVWGYQRRALTTWPANPVVFGSGEKVWGSEVQTFSGPPVEGQSEIEVRHGCAGARPSVEGMGAHSRQR